MKCGKYNKIESRCSLALRGEGDLVNVKEDLKPECNGEIDNLCECAYFGNELSDDKIRQMRDKLRCYGYSNVALKSLKKIQNRIEDLDNLQREFDVKLKLPRIKYPSRCKDCPNMRDKDTIPHCSIPSDNGDLVENCWRW